MKDLVIKLTGQITDSNFDQWKDELIIQIQSANKELSTDSDFAEAEDTVKQFKVAEKSLVDAKQSALEQAADIQKLFGAIDEISEEARQARLSLEKQIKQRKQEIKQNLFDEYTDKLSGLISEQSEDFKLVSPDIFSSDDLHEIMKNKKTIESMRKSLDLFVSDAKAEIDVCNQEISANRVGIENIDSQYKSLFQDEKVLLSMSHELLTSTIKQRISVHEAQQAKRKAAELEREKNERELKEAEEARLKSEKLQREKAENDEQSTKERLPVADEQAERREPDSTGSGGPDNKKQFQEKTSISGNRPSLKEAIGEFLDDEETEQQPEIVTENFNLTIAITGTTNDAKDIASQINNLIGKDDRIKQIKLTRQNNQQEAA